MPAFDRCALALRRVLTQINPSSFCTYRHQRCAGNPRAHSLCDRLPQNKIISPVQQVDWIRANCNHILKTLREVLSHFNTANTSRAPCITRSSLLLHFAEYTVHSEA
jgi:hypothetical protein